MAQTTAKELAAVSQNSEIRPFSVFIPEEALVDIRQFITATRWPDREIVDDRSQGVQLATMIMNFLTTVKIPASRLN